MRRACSAPLAIPWPGLGGRQESPWDRAAAWTPPAGSRSPRSRSIADPTGTLLVLRGMVFQMNLTGFVRNDSFSLGAEQPRLQGVKQTPLLGCLLQGQCWNPGPAHLERFLSFTTTRGVALQQHGQSFWKKDPLPQPGRWTDVARGASFVNLQLAS